VIPIALDLQDAHVYASRGTPRPPAIVAPAPREVSFGKIAGKVSARTARVVVKVDGVVKGSTVPAHGRFRLTLDLPPRDIRVRIIAEDRFGNRAGRSVAPVYGLPRAANPTGGRPSAEDARLARRVKALARAHPGIAAVYVQDLRTRVGAAWNARARFPAASTVKVAIAVEVLRVLGGRPARGGSLGRQLWSMLVDSDNEAANALLTWLGGSTSGGAAEVNATLRSLGIDDSLLYGGYALGTAARRPIPIRVEEQPDFGLGKHTTAYDLARLHSLLHMAAHSKGALRRVPGSFTGADARFLLRTLAHVADPGKLDRYLPSRFPVLHKAGWITTVRHDAGIVYSPEGAFVAVVMTWNAAGVGTSSDVLAGRVAATALRRFDALRGEAAGDSSTRTTMFGWS
jgi:beta-lactamase class A